MTATEHGGCVEQVRLVPYDPDWPRQFDEERILLSQIFADSTVRIEHVGSTSVPGLTAKPVIDILVGVSDLRLAESRIAPLLSCGYEYVREYEVQKPGRRYFRKPQTRPRTHHLHCVVLGSEDWSRTILFRDRLRDEPAIAEAYSDLKHRLAKTVSKKGFTDAKTPFIEAVLGRTLP
jgi:GrpB-like predicted nucleotidyltransferase (UPF0157 family)